jgi:hypothetical protein
MKKLFRKLFPKRSITLNISQLVGRVEIANLRDVSDTDLKKRLESLSLQIEKPIAEAFLHALQSSLQDLDKME